MGVGGEFSESFAVEVGVRQVMDILESYERNKCKHGSKKGNKE